MIVNEEEEQGTCTDIAQIVQTAHKIEPSHIATLVPAQNNYVGTEWTMPNGLKVTVKQGDLVEAETEVRGYSEPGK